MSANQTNVEVPDIFNGGTPHIDHLHLPLLQTLDNIDSQDFYQSVLGKEVTDFYNQSLLAINSLEKSIKAIESQVIKYKLQTSDNPSLYALIGDSFNDDSLIDSNSFVTLDPEGGYLIIPVETMENINPYIGEIKISPDSIGRPGDVTTVRAIRVGKEETTDKRKNESVSVDASADPYDDPTALIDQRPDTLYVWENVSVPRRQPLSFKGREGSSVYTPGEKEYDLLNVSNNLGLVWKGIIPGVGEADRKLFEFIDSEKDIKDARLVIDLKFTSPVPLSTLRLTPISDMGLPLPVVENVEVYTEKGVAQPPALPRTISPEAGRNLNIPQSTVSFNTLEGSGIFQLKLNALATGVRIYLKATSKELPLGVAHKFLSKSTDSSEKHYILGARVATLNKKSNKRVASQETEESRARRGFRLGGDYFSQVIGSEIYNSVNRFKDSLRSTNAPVLDKLPNIDLGKSSTANKAERFLNNELDRQTQSVRSKLANAKASREIINNVAGKTITKVLGKKVTAMIGLTGVGGLLLGAALNGDVFGRNKTVNTSYLERVDVWKGYRALIGIRDISLDSRSYFESAEVVTKSLTFKENVRACSIVANVEVPKDWGEGNWFESFIQSEGSSEWLPVKAVGSPSEKDTSPNEVSFSESVSSIKCKFILRRPVGRESESPIFSGYIVKGLPG